MVSSELRRSSCSCYHAMLDIVLLYITWQQETGAIRLLYFRQHSCWGISVLTDNASIQCVLLYIVIMTNDVTFLKILSHENTTIFYSRWYVVWSIFFSIFRWVKRRNFHSKLTKRTFLVLVNIMLVLKSVCGKWVFVIPNSTENYVTEKLVCYGILSISFR